MTPSRDVTRVQTVSRAVVRFAGDSGDGIQMIGDRFSADAGTVGNDFSTLADFPAEIRPPAGSVAGVSSFQLHFADFYIETPGDKPDVLVAMNPAALKAHLGDLKPGGLLIADTAEFTQHKLARVGYLTNPLQDGSLDEYDLHAIDLTGRTVAAVESFGLRRKDAQRARNMYTLGLLTWLYSHPVQPTLEFLDRKFECKPGICQADKAAFLAGHAYGETAQAFTVRYEVAPAPMPPGTYRQIKGSRALAYGLLAGAVKANLTLVLGAYPITPASGVLHELSHAKDHGVLTLQVEDEIAAAGVALGASYAGALGVTVTSGPGMALMSETISLAVMLEQPLVVCDVQRAGPSTGMPTKIEQADLVQAMFGRHGEAPLPVIAAKSSSDCFDAAVEAIRVALTYGTPVILLSDAYLANGAEPWIVPNLTNLPAIDPCFATEPNGPDSSFLPYLRDEKLARALAVPGTPGLEHRIGGLEKADRTGNVSYDPANHELMVRLRQAKVDGVVAEVPDVEVDDPSGSATTLVLGWGSTWGPIRATARRVRMAGRKVATAHLRWVNPLPANLGDVLRQYRRIILPEMNLGQLAMVLRAKYLVDVVSYSRVRGLPISPGEFEPELLAFIDGADLP